MGWVLVFLIGAAGGMQTEDLARKIERQVVSPCCFSQTVDQHRSGAASDVRTDIRRMLREGRSEKEILGVLVQKHGTKVLAVPEAKGFNASVWWMPVVAVVVGGLGLRSYLSRTSRSEDTVVEPLASSDRERLEALLKVEL